MSKALSLVLLLACSCSSDSSSSPSNAPKGGDSGACPDLSGSWTVSQHCDSTVVGMTAAVTQQGCSMTFAAPFTGFTGSVAADGSVTISGQQSCTGKVSGNTISMDCTPHPCPVTLTK